MNTSRHILLLSLSTSRYPQPCLAAAIFSDFSDTNSANNNSPQGESQRRNSDFSREEMPEPNGPTRRSSTRNISSGTKAIIILHARVASEKRFCE